MVSRLMQLVQNANLSSSLRSCSKHSVAELILGHHLRAAEGKKDTTLLNTLQALYIQAGITLQRITQSRTVLGKSRRIQNYQIILLIMFIKIFEGIFADSLMTCIPREIERNILIGQFYRLGTAVNRVNSLSLTSHRINRKSSGIAEHVEHTLSLGIMLEQRTVLTLIYKETGFLTSQPVDMEFQPILYSYIVSITSQDKTILLSEISLIRQGGLTLIVDVFQCIAHHLLQGIGNLHAANMHSHTVSLHDSCRTIAVDNKSRQVISLTMNQTISRVG